MSQSNRLTRELLLVLEQSLAERDRARELRSQARECDRRARHAEETARHLRRRGATTGQGRAA